MGVKRDWLIFKLKRVLYWVWGVTNDWLLVVGEAFIPHESMTLIWCLGLGCFFFREEFGMLLMGLL